MTNINNLQFILNNSVNTLALRNISYISDFGIIELAKAINVNTNLTDLDLRYNNICVIELAKSISNNTTLTNNLTSLSTKQRNDHNLVYNELHTLLA